MAKDPEGKLFVKKLPDTHLRPYAVMWATPDGRECHVASYFTETPAVKLIDLMKMLEDLDIMLSAAHRLEHGG